jgi:hypothetical protein
LSGLSMVLYVSRGGGREGVRRCYYTNQVLILKGEFFDIDACVHVPIMERGAFCASPFAVREFQTAVNRSTNAAYL